MRRYIHDIREHKACHVTPSLAVVTAPIFAFEARLILGLKEARRGPVTIPSLGELCPTRVYRCKSLETREGMSVSHLVRSQVTAKAK
jgi:hypothetical protein